MPMQCQPSSSRTLLPVAGMRYYCNIDSVKEIDTVLECVDITSPSPQKKKLKSHACILIKDNQVRTKMKFAHCSPINKCSMIA